LVSEKEGAGFALKVYMSYYSAFYILGFGFERLKG